MRTIDPAHWSYKLRKRPLNNFGQQAPTRMEVLIRRSFVKTVMEFCSVTQVKGTRLQGDVMSSEFERRIWRWILWLVLVVGSATSGLLVMTKRQVPALNVALPSLEHNIQGIPFPAVALCDYYVMDLKRVQEYAKFLYDNKSPRPSLRNYTVDYIQSNLIHYGALINFDQMNNNYEFIEFIRAVDYDSGWNTTKLMMHLSLPCSEQLIQCAWRGYIQPCEDLFAMRITQWGLCCVFNSRYHLEDADNKPYILDKTGQDNGISIVVKRKQENRGYIRRIGSGTEVLLFNGDEYPLMEGGGVVSVPAPANRSTYIILSATAMEASADVLTVSEARRGCQFNEETYITCLNECKKETIDSLCGCVPFQLIPSDDHFQCNLNQLACLNKYREKFMFYYPYGEPDPALQEEYADSLECFCVPDCLRTRYSVKVSFGKFQKVNRNKTFKNFFVRNIDITNTSIIRIYYATEGQRLYSVEVVEQWFELISIVGSQFSAVIGITIMLGIEVIYFLTFRWWLHFNTMRNLQVDRFPSTQ